MDIATAERAKILLAEIKELEEIISILDGKNGATINFMLYYKMDNVATEYIEISSGMNQLIYDVIEKKLRSLKLTLENL